MGKNIKSVMRKGEVSLYSAFARGAAVALISEVLLLAVASALTTAGVIAERNMAAAAAVCACVSAFAGAVVGGGRAVKLSLPIAVGVGAAEFAVNFLLGLTTAESGGFAVLMPAAFMVGAIAGGILCVFGKTGKKHTRALRV